MGFKLITDHVLDAPKMVITRIVYTYVYRLHIYTIKHDKYLHRHSPNEHNVILLYLFILNLILFFLGGTSFIRLVIGALGWRSSQVHLTIINHHTV